jgi:integrase
LFGEYIEGVSWLSVPCNERISYTTKGKRPKRLPLVEPLASLLAHAKPGLLFVRRSVFEGTEQPPLLGFSLEELASEFQRRLRNDPVAAGSAAGKQRIRDKLLKEAGGLTYDDIEGEFKKLAGKLGWPPAAALKDLRHLFATSLAAAGMSEPYRKYLMGHAFSAGAIGAYTHLPRIREQYQTVLQKEWPSLVQAVHKRLHELSKHSPAASVLSSSREDAAEAS